jgi:hypothetical protein
VVKINIAKIIEKLPASCPNFALQFDPIRVRPRLQRL